MGVLAVAGWCPWPLPRLLLHSLLLRSPPSLPKPERSTRTINAEPGPGNLGFFYGEKLVAMAFFSYRGDLELQIKAARGTLAAVDP